MVLQNTRQLMADAKIFEAYSRFDSNLDRSLKILSKDYL